MTSRQTGEGPWIGWLMIAAVAGMATPYLPRPLVGVALLVAVIALISSFLALTSERSRD